MRSAGDPWTIGGATIKGFNIFTVGVALVGFVGLLLFLKKTALRKGGAGYRRR